MKKYILCIALLYSEMIIAVAQETPDIPQTCTQIAEDRMRLVCFDRIFKTPFHPNPTTEPHNGTSNKKKHPLEWESAWDKEKKRAQGEAGFFMTQTKGNFLDSIILTLPVEDLGLLVFSCVDKISRVELMLNTPVEDGTIPIKIEGRESKVVTWLSDDTGYIIRVGRGIPSINVMKNMIDQSQITLSFRKNYVIELGDISKKIKPLRNTCTW